MTPQEFIAALEQQMAKQAAIGSALARIPAVAAQQAARGPGLLQRGLNAAGRGAGIAADEGLTALDNLGRVTRHGAGKAMDAGKNFVDNIRGKAKPDTAYKPRLTNSNPNERGLIPYTGPDSRALSKRPTNFEFYKPPGRTWGNIGTGAGVAGLTAAGLTAANPYRSGGQVPAARPMPTQQQQGEGGGLMDMWHNLPVEARYAIGAGVPLALMGAFAGGNGQTTAGMGMGAAGLGLAGLGAAHGGYFGKNMQGGAQSIMNMLNGRGQDPHYSAYLQGNLSNDLENNSTRSVKKSSNSLQSFGALVEKTSAGRCWTGYEPVPGKAPYSNDSCRPKGSKKKKTEKKAIAGCGVTSMSETPSSRGTVKKISDEQKSTPSPKPTDAENQTQKASQAYLWAAQLSADMDKEAFLGGMARSVGNAIGGAGNYVQQGLNNFADRSEQSGKNMYYGGMRTLNKITAPINQAGAAVGGFIQGGIQGAKNIVALPGQAATAAGNAIQSGVDTAKSYIPSVRNPLHYPNQAEQPAGAM